MISVKAAAKLSRPTLRTLASASGCKNNSRAALMPQWACHSFSTLYSQSPEEENEEYQQSHFEEQPTQFSSKNVRLEAIKSVGLTQLHNNTQDLISRTRQPLFEENLADAYGNKAPSIAQIQEANALETVIIDSFAAYSSKNTTFSLKGMCIDILGVEVSPDLRHARVYWCLPLSLDLHQLPHSKLEQVVKRMQQRLEERGGKIQALVHTRLRANFPPKIKWVPAEHVSKDLNRAVSQGGGRKKWS